MEDCIFCKIARKEIASDIIYEDQRVIAFRDVYPKAPVHVLVIPKEHHTSLKDFSPPNCETAGEIFSVAETVAQKEGIAPSGFRLILNQGKNAGQEVDHLHVHVLGGKPLGPMISR
ncbi:MAG TPA: histidine triad nucleotide-binding protein [Candidatus Subteraquimicrobiales bacterium]